ncbi:hypothetical protein CERSUDRAFT_87569 [Gelatoporia subvermispora B]|uniref:Peptidase S8/S53 domain-containing protein n=1 Tax=Ceriporiopsis subvermispora (strain B) TaxID=914234 RepID=M2QM59_CERS8|nr:hypothetical protein CERSUDRAFT_87569 [Gelatoporia subvermispora B]
MFIIPLLAASLAYASPLSTFPHDVPRERTGLTFAPLMAEHHPHGTVNGSYIVMFRDDIAPTLMQNHMNFVASAHEEVPLVGDGSDGLTHIYDGHVKGYAGKFSEATVSRIRQMPEVEYVELDQIVKTLEIAPTMDSFETQRGAPWGLARVSHRPRLTFSTFTKYEYDKDGGEGVDVYVIDTGIFVGHAEFEGRASWGKTVPQNDVDEDGNGHGTHCAGTIASRKYGIAKKAHVVAVKVLGSNGSGTMSDVVSGVVWAAESAAAKMAAAKEELARTGKTKHKGSVANMSLGGGKSRALDDTVNKAVDNGMHFSVAAGNDNRDACNNSPAAAEKAVTVGASTLGDERAYFSNHGTCVDVFAPGLNILSTWVGSPVATSTLSGTSMASPHTAGMLAYLLSIYPSKTFNPALEPDLAAPALLRVYAAAHAVLPGWAAAFLPPHALVEAVAPTPKDPTLTPAELKRQLLLLSTPGALDELPKGTPNLLIFNNATA